MERQSRAFFRRRLPLLALCAIAVAQLLCVPGRYLGEEHDDVQYVAAARSMLHGRYSLGVSPGDPPLTFNTPGWPALLAPAALLSGDSPLGYQLWSWAWLVLCDILAWLWLRRRLGAGLGLAATALFGLNPLVLSRAGVAMSEVPALAAGLGLFLLMDRPAGLPGWAGGFWLGFAWLIRPGAVTLWPALLGRYVLGGRWRRVLSCLSCGGVLVLAWKAWVNLHGSGLAEARELAASMPGDLRGICSVAAWNLRSALATWGHTVMPLAPDRVSEQTATAAGALLAAGALGGMLRRQGPRSFEPAAAYLLAGAALHLAWPFWYERYLVPYLPFLAWGLASLLRSRAPRAAVPSLILLTLLSVPQGAAIAIESRRRAPALRRTYSWIKQRTGASDVFASAFYCRDAFYSGRPFVPLPDRDIGARLRASRARYVLWVRPPDLGVARGSRSSPETVLRDVALELSRPGYRLAFDDGDEGSAIYEVLRLESRTIVTRRSP